MKISMYYISGVQICDHSYNALYDVYFLRKVHGVITHFQISSLNIFRNIIHGLYIKADKFQYVLGILKSFNDAYLFLEMFSLIWVD